MCGVVIGDDFGGEDGCALAFRGALFRGCCYGYVMGVSWTIESGTFSTIGQRGAIIACAE